MKLVKNKCDSDEEKNIQLRATFTNVQQFMKCVNFWQVIQIFTTCTKISAQL